MFKEEYTVTPPNKHNFGIGSVFYFNKKYSYAVVSVPYTDQVCLLDLHNMEMLSESFVSVVDKGWLTEGEARDVVFHANINASFNELCFDNTGIKTL